MTDWVDGDEATVVADDSFHAGIAKDLIRGNLLCCVEQSGYDVSTYHHDGDISIDHALSTTNTYELFTEFPPVILPARWNKTGDGLRDVKVYIDGKCSDAGTATVRVYLRSNWNRLVAPDASGGFVGATDYAELTFDSTDWQTDSNTITPTTDDVTTRTTPVAHEYTVVIVIVSVDAAMTISLRAPRFQEIPT